MGRAELAGRGVRVLRAELPGVEIPRSIGEGMGGGGSGGGGGGGASEPDTPTAT